MHRIYRLVFFFAAAALLLPAAGSAQSVWVDSVEGSAFRAEFHRPVFDYLEATTFSGIWTFGATIDAGPRKQVHIEVPYARFDSENWSSSSSTIGNLYVGMIHRNPASDFRVLVGGRLPTTSDDEGATLIGMVAEEVDCPEAFFPHVASLTAALEYRPETRQGLGVRTRLAPILWFDTGDDSNMGLQDGIEIWLHYHAQVVMVAPEVTVGAGLSGRFLFSEDGDSLSDRNVLEAGIFINFDMGRWAPTARLKIPLDDDSQEYLDPALVFGVAMDMGPR